VALAVLMAGCRGANPELTVCAAASLQQPLGELARRYEQRTPGTRIAINYGASGTLAQQIVQGAPADVFLSAAPKPMDLLEGKGLVAAGTRADLLRNRIVLVTPAQGGGPAGFQALADPKWKLVALGDPASVPAGDYGKQVLESLGLWKAVEPRLLLAKDVRQVLAYVETGNADAGIVYATDARSSKGVRVAAEAPEGTHTPVIYPVAALKESRAPAAARALVQFLESAEAREVFTRHGFTAAER
jgi:molybdate transport system substrate-binding protein